MGDLFIAWLLVLFAVSALYFIKRQPATDTIPNHHNHASGKNFYDHFGATAAIAVVLTSLLYVFVVIPGYFDSKIMLLDKILFRGPIPYITLGVFVWVILNVLLLARRMVFQRQQDVLIENILAGDSEQKQAEINSISTQAVLKRRLLDISHGGNDSSKAHLTQLVDQQSAMEREDVTVSILYLHTAMWAIPVLGFLGTVWGIAEAVANLIPLLKGLSASELGGSQLADSLAGLGVAFDTTLVALSLSLPAMALISLLEKAAHEDMLVRDRILLRHANDWV
jgi:biopolymer transport protein ExbB/TolQ